MLIVFKLLGSGILIFAGVLVGMLQIERKRNIVLCLYEYKNLLEYIRVLVDSKSYSPDEILYEIQQIDAYPHLHLRMQQHLRDYMLPGWLPPDIQELSKVFSQIGTLESEQLYKIFQIYLLLADDELKKAYESRCNAEKLYIKIGATVGAVIALLLF